jgi:ribosomal-protein-alanine N-acetyltransferase
MAKVTIRPAVAADFDALLKMDQECFPEGVSYDAKELSYFISHTGTETIVLEEDGTVVAFLMVEIHAYSKSATLITLDVQEHFRRKGYAAQLLQRAEALLQAQGIQKCILQVDVGNQAALSFYRTRGFEKVRMLPKYYANGNDAYLMVKRLPSSAQA